MKGTKTLFMILFAMVILGILPASAIDGTEVLRSDQKDKVTIQYNISERNGNTTVYFSNVRKEVSIENSEKYKDNNNVQVVFFERTGDYQGAEFTLKNGVNIRSNFCIYMDRQKLHVFLGLIFLGQKIIFF